MLEAVDRFGRELRDGDVVAFGVGRVQFGRFSHATEKRLMVKVPEVSTYRGGFYYSQQLSTGLIKLDAATVDVVQADFDRIDGVRAELEEMGDKTHKWAGRMWPRGPAVPAV
jgi:flagellar basal body P-ring protein FlgI